MLFCWRACISLCVGPAVVAHPAEGHLGPDISDAIPFCPPHCPSFHLVSPALKSLTSKSPSPLFSLSVKMGIISDAASNVHAILQFVKRRVDGTVEDIHAVGLGMTAENAQSLLTYATQMEDGKGVQDKDMRMEKLLAWLFKIPPSSGSGFARALEHLIISSLWNTLPHPVTSWAKLSGPQYRDADGAYNNPDVPNVGKAGERYIRDVTPDVDTMRAQRHLHNGKGLPPPEDVFEKLYRRRKPGEDGSAGFKKHPCGISSNMFYFATLITHDLFNTDIDDRFINKTTSYVDLVWLYGVYQSYSTVEPDRLILAMPQVGIKGCRTRFVTKPATEENYTKMSLPILV